MKNNNIVAGINCLVGSVLTTVVVMVGDFIIMLFSSGEDGRRTCFFDTIYFSSTPQSDGSLSIGFGLTGDLIPIFTTIIAIFSFYFLVYIIYKKLERYQQKVINERNGQANDK